MENDRPDEPKARGRPKTLCEKILPSIPTYESVDGLAGYENAAYLYSMKGQFTMRFNTTFLAQQVSTETIQTTVQNTFTLTTLTTYDSLAAATSPLLTQELFKILRAVLDPGRKRNILGGDR